ncbi:MAG: tetratricopeptide repeat protein [Acidobacteriota bacterium]|nr:tetratricopeptide repeat protein [Acidobacteriota bacterium]
MFPTAPDGTPPALAGNLDRGWQYLQLDDVRNAEREFLAALKVQPAFHPIETAMGYLAMARGNEKEAVTRFEKALQADATYVPALVGRGRVLLELERVPEALASFEAALAKDPGLADLRSRVEVLRFRSTQDTLARAKAAADAQRWDVAKAAYLQAIAASPDSAFLYRELAAVEQRAGQTPDAIEHYRKAVELDPSDARSLAALGTILEGQGDVLASLDYYERARAIDLSEVPDSVVARVRARAALARLPAEYRAIPSSPAITRGEFAAILGIRLELVTRARPRQVIITDVRRHWAQQWITAVVRAGIMDTQTNYEFQPGQRIRRGDVAEVVARLLGLIASEKPEVPKKWAGARVQVTDVPVRHLSYPAVSVAVASGVMPLVNGGFDVLHGVSGAEAFEIVGRLEALARP